jgi:hypothetical protein
LYVFDDMFLINDQKSKNFFIFYYNFIKIMNKNNNSIDIKVIYKKKIGKNINFLKENKEF